MELALVVMPNEVSRCRKRFDDAFGPGRGGGLIIYEDEIKREEVPSRDLSEHVKDLQDQLHTYMARRWPPPAPGKPSVRPDMWATRLETDLREAYEFMTSKVMHDPTYG